MTIRIGDTVLAPNAGKNAVVRAISKGPWGGTMFFLEVDEPLPYIGRPNPRRSLWVHESHAYAEESE